MATTYLSRTEVTGSTDTDKKFTISLWIKRGSLGVTQVMCSSGSSVSAGLDLYFDTNNNFTFEALDGSDNPKIITDREFRDVGAWMNIVVAIDTPQATDTDRVKIYVNGIQETEFSTETYPAQDYQFSIGTTSDTMKVGTGTMAGATNYWNGNMAHLHYTDGQVYAASNFGSTDATSGIWVPNSAPSVTYGNNGLFLKFASGALGTDSSGNANTMAATGTLTATKDNAMNNFCTMNPLADYYASSTFSNGNNTVTTDQRTYNIGTMGLASGKWYFETKLVSYTGGTQDSLIGIADTDSTAVGNQLGISAYQWGYYGRTGGYYNNNSDTSYGDTWTTGAVIGTYIDLDNLKIYWALDGAVQNSGTGITLTAASESTGGAYLPAMGYWDTSNNAVFATNFGNGYFGTDLISGAVADAGGEGQFKYNPSTGTFDSASKDFRAICTNNLATYGG